MSYKPRDGDTYHLQRTARMMCRECEKAPQAGQSVVYWRDVTGQMRIWHRECWAARCARVAERNRRG